MHCYPKSRQIYTADWRREFKKAWVDARSMPVGIETQHATDVVTRVCSCKKCSRFLLCKHLVKRKELTGPVAADFFRNVGGLELHLLGDSDPEDIEPSPEELFDYLEATCTDFLELIRKGARNPC